MRCRCGNVAAILELDENLNKQFRVFDAAPQVDPAYVYPLFRLSGQEPLTYVKYLGTFGIKSSIRISKYPPLSVNILFWWCRNWEGPRPKNPPRITSCDSSQLLICFTIWETENFTDQEDGAVVSWSWCLDRLPLRSPRPWSSWFYSVRDWFGSLLSSRLALHSLFDLPLPFHFLLCLPIHGAFIIQLYVSIVPILSAKRLMIQLKNSWHFCLVKRWTWNN